MEPKDDEISPDTITRLKIKNFRNAAGMKNIFRCASTDNIGELDHSDTSKWAFSDRFVYEKAGLILDLRSPIERDVTKAQKWLSSAEVQIVDTGYYLNNVLCKFKDGHRFLVRVNVLSRARFMTYIEEKWLNTKEKRKVIAFKDRKALSTLRIEKLNQRGLCGLNQIILESGKKELCMTLKIITLHLERKPEDNVVIHCVQGKDRTGMLVMLLQSILGFPDNLIIEDYYISNKMIGSSAAATTLRPTKSGRMNRNIFAGANREAMLSTLYFLRQKYDSVSPGYTDHIGFHIHWRKRLIAVLPLTSNLKRSSKL